MEIHKLRTKKNEVEGFGVTPILHMRQTIIDFPRVELITRFKDWKWIDFVFEVDMPKEKE